MGFWERHQPPPPAAPDPDALLAVRAGPQCETAGVTLPSGAAEPVRPRRKKEFCRDPPSDAANGESAPAAPGAAEFVPHPAVALSIAEGVTLLMENVSPELFDENRLAELAPVVRFLAAELRRLHLISP